MSSPEPHLPANQLEATTIHEIEAGFSPLEVAVLGTHDITDAMFLGLVEFEVDELLRHCVDQGITHRYLPEGKVRREWWGAQFWDENGDEVEGSFEDAKAACEPGEMWCYITSREPREGFAPVTAINLRGHEDVALKALAELVEEKWATHRIITSYLGAVDRCKQGGPVQAVHIAEHELRKVVGRV